MNDKAYRTTRYKLTLASTIIDRLMFICGFIAAFCAYYVSINIAASFSKSMSEALVISTSEEYSFLNDLIAELNSFLGNAAQIAGRWLAIALLISVTVALIIHIIYMLPMLIVSRVSLANARSADFPATGDAERFRCDSILKITMHVLKLIFITVLAIAFKIPVLLVLAVPYVTVIVLSIVVLAVKSDGLKFEQVEVEPIPETPQSEYFDFDYEA